MKTLWNNLHGAVQGAIVAISILMAGPPMFKLFELWSCVWGYCGK